MLRYVIVGAILLVITVVSATLMYSQRAVTAELAEAVRRNDAAAFGARIEWNSLREFLKTDLDGKKKLPGAQNTGPAPDQIARVVDYYVQPENIDLLFYFREELFRDVPVEDFIYERGFSPPFGFSLTLGWPKNIQKGEVPSVLLERMKVRIVFRLDGLTWKAEEMHVPLFMVPDHVYSEPAVKVFGRRQ
jgi:hypothetical protein